jgi:hypothetical protein
MTPDCLIKCPSEKSAETLGYCHASLRDEGIRTHVALGETPVLLIGNS